jgi:hypothetical protein
MRRVLTLAAVLAAARAFAGPIGSADPHAAAPTGFPGAYLGTVSLSLAADPIYASRLLDSFSMHLQAISVMTAPPEVKAYLEQSAMGSTGLEPLREALGRETLDAPKASALLLADALDRPEQFRELLVGLEQMKPGLGKQTASMLRLADVTGSLPLLRALQSAGERDPDGTPLAYGPDGRIDLLFDGSSSDGRDGVVMKDPESAQTQSSSGYGPSGRTRASGLLPTARP